MYSNTLPFIDTIVQLIIDRTRRLSGRESSSKNFDLLYWVTCCKISGMCDLDLGMTFEQNQTLKYQQPMDPNKVYPNNIVPKDLNICFQELNSPP